MKRLYRYTWLMVALIAFVSCEKTLRLELDKQPQVLVVDARIEEGEFPVVVLSRSLDYFSEMDFNTMLNALVRGARVSISNGTDSVVLKEYFGGSSTASNDPPVRYSVDTAASKLLRGERGKTYTLRIESEGRVYNSVTQIPAHAKTLDSIWWKPLPKISDTPFVAVMVRVTDPPGFGNYIRYFIKTQHDVRWFPAEISVYDDQVVDGKTYDIQIGMGIDWNDKDSTWGYMHGDTVSVKFCNIDKAGFDFWRTWETNMRSIGNPFTAPGKVLGNISNGALGAFCGYSVQRRTVIIPK